MCEYLKKKEAANYVHCACHCSVFYEIKGRYRCLFKKGFGSVHKVMEYERGSIVFGAFLARTQETQEVVEKQ